jgi:hypothetical protein
VRRLRAAQSCPVVSARTNCDRSPQHPIVAIGGEGTDGRPDAEIDKLTVRVVISQTVRIGTAGFFMAVAKWPAHTGATAALVLAMAWSFSRASRLPAALSKIGGRLSMPDRSLKFVIFPHRWLRGSRPNSERRGYVRGSRVRSGRRPCRNYRRARQVVGLPRGNRCAASIDIYSGWCRRDHDDQCRSCRPRVRGER